MQFTVYRKLSLSIELVSLCPMDDVGWCPSVHQCICMYIRPSIHKQ